MGSASYRSLGGNLKQLDADDGELARTQKVRRRIIEEKYRALIDALYNGSTNVFAETEVTYEDGRKGKISATLERSVPTGQGGSCGMTSENRERKSTDTKLARVIGRLVKIYRDLFSDVERDVLYVGACAGFVVHLFGLGETLYILTIGIFASAGASVRVGILKVLQIAGWDV